MERLSWVACVVLVAAGCQSPTPTFDPFAGYGNTRVPPPSTGSIGQAPGYFQQPRTTVPIPPAGTLPPSTPIPPPMMAPLPGAQSSYEAPVPLPATSPDYRGETAQPRWNQVESAVPLQSASRNASRADNSVRRNRQLQLADDLQWRSPVGASGSVIRQATATSPVTNPLAPLTDPVYVAPATTAPPAPASLRFTQPPASLPPAQTPRYLPAPQSSGFQSTQVIQPQVIQPLSYAPAVATQESCHCDPATGQPYGEALEPTPMVSGASVVYHEQLASSRVGWQSR
ncbi:MAG: hypothetical protein KDA60_01785 [Planctomycetales bacterium]|nr:hypothetical protein [Planctomycetales bacterium]